MHSLLRIALPWLLVLALPAQGYAAHAMLFCGPGHHQAAVGAVADHDHASHGHEQASFGSHEASGAADVSEDEDQQNSKAEPAAKSKPGKTTHGKCSVCASCCSMSAIASPYVGLETVRVSATYALALFEPHAGRTVGGLERPPKSLLV